MSQGVGKPKGDDASLPGTALTYYDGAKANLAQALQVDEVKDIRDKAMAMAVYAKQARDGELIAHATEIKMRAERRLGEMMREQPKAKPPGGSKARPRKDRDSEKPDLPITLKEAGIDKNLADRARKAAAMTQEKFETKVETAKRKAEDSATVSPRYPRGEFTGEVERGTPDRHLGLVLRVMGPIDVDTYSSDFWQRRVKAGKHFTIKDDALKQEWHGRVFMNCPYRQPCVTEAVRKLIAERMAGRTTEAIALLPGSIDPEWFHLALSHCDAVCFVRGRINFIDAEGNEMDSPPLGSLFFYFGPHADRFTEVFSQVGSVLPMDGLVMAAKEAAE